MVPLTHHEYLWIQHARSSGVDFSKLPKFVPEQETLPLGAAHSSQFAQPQQPPLMSFSAPTTMATPTSATAPSFPETSKPDRAKSCCKSKASPAEEVPTGPSSPRCKCGDACRCVPCADHPFNPAMLETIKGDMLHLQNPSEQSSSNGTGRGQSADQKNSPSAYDQDGYPDEQSPADSGSNNIMADFNNFVFHNYSYGSGCMEGQGGCMCGEGCTCVGCLTHGGHDGVSLQSLGDSVTTNTDANGSGNNQQHGQQQQTEQQPGHDP